MKEELECLKDFWQRWGYEPDDREEFLKFRNRIKDIARYFWGQHLSLIPAMQKEFAFQFGLSMGILTGRIDYDVSPLRQLIDTASTHFEIIQAMQYLLETF